MRDQEAGWDEGTEFQAFLWSMLDDANRQRLVEFDDRREAVLDVSARVHIAAAAYHIVGLCYDLEHRPESFEETVADLLRDGSLPPEIRFFEGFAGAATAVACLSSYDLYGEDVSMAARRAVAERLLRRAA